MVRNALKINIYNLGYAYLTRLYRGVCKEAYKGVEKLSGCNVLLQTWGWSNMQDIALINSNAYVYSVTTKKIKKIITLY